MKKVLSFVGLFFALAIVGQILTVRPTVQAAPYPTGVGGLGTSVTPASGTIPIGNGAGSYTPGLLTPSGTVAIVNGSGSVTIVGTGATTTIQSVLNALSAAGLASYNPATGVFTVSSSSLALGTASHNSTSDFLSSSTAYVHSFNTRTGAVTLSSGDVTTALGFTPYNATNPAGYLTSSTGVTSFNGSSGAVTFSAATGTEVYYVAASNAPSPEKFTANLICTGTDDGNCIQSAINTVSSTFPNGSGIIQLSDGTFNVSSTIVNLGNNFIGLEGAGPNNTLINMTSTDLTGVHWGNGQVSNSNTTGYLSNFTINGNSTSSVPLWIDGGGSGSTYNNIDIDSNVKYGYILEDADRVSLNNVRASGGYIAACDYRVGSQNTFGKVLNENGECGVTYSSSTGVLFDADSDQSSPNSPDVVTFTNLHMQENNGISSGTCMATNVGLNDFTVNGSGFEDCDNQFETNGHEVDGSLNADSMINTYRQSQNCVDVEGYSNMTFNADSFQQCVNGFNGGSGFPNLFFNGTNKNNGNITNLFTGGFASLQGNDTNFAGPNKLQSGLQNDPYSTVWTGVISATSTAKSVIGNLDSQLFADQFPGSDIGSGANAAYGALATPSNNQGGGNILINNSSSYSTQILFGTAAKYANLIAPEGTQLTWTGTGAAYEDNSGGGFFHTAHTLQGLGIFGKTFPSANATTVGIACGGSNGCIGMNTNGVTVVGLGTGYQLNNNAYMDSITNSIFRNDNQAFVATSSNNSGENIYVGQSQFVDCGNNTTTKCIYFAPFAADTMLAADSFDDAQVYYDNGNYDILQAKIHSENSNVSAYHSYVQTVLTTSTDLTELSGDYNNDSSASSNDPLAFIQDKGGNLLSVGTVFQANGGDTILDAVTGTGCAVYLFDHNVNGAATNLYGSAGWPAFDDSFGCGVTNLSTTTAPAITIKGNATTANLTVTAVTNGLGSFNGSGTLSAYAGSVCTAGSLVSGVSASGTVSCVTTSTILAGIATPTVTTTTKSIYDMAPSSTDDIVMYYADTAFTIRQIDCVNDNAIGNSATFNLTWGTNRNSTTSNAFTSPVVCNSTSTISTPAMTGSTTVAAGSIIRTVFSSASSTGIYVDLKF